MTVGLSLIHILCGMVCGWPYGLAVGEVMPLLCGLLFGMPVLYPTGIGMAFELRCV